MVVLGHHMYDVAMVYCCFFLLSDQHTEPLVSSPTLLFNIKSISWASVAVHHLQGGIQFLSTVYESIHSHLHKNSLLTVTSHTPAFL